MRILVTGAAGFIGSHLCERLLRRGHDVVGMDSFDSFYDPWIKERNLAAARAMDRFVEVRGDIRDAEAYAHIPGEIDCVVHLAARAGVRPSIEEPELYFDVNVSGTVTLLEFMRRRNIQRLVFGSSSSVYGDSAPVPFSEEDRADRPISPYAATKRSGELLVHSHADLYGMSAVCLRFFTVYGPRQRPDLAIHKFARLLHTGEPIPMFGDGSTERDYTEIEDILDGVEGAIHYLARHPRAYEIVNLGGARTIALHRMIRLLSEALDVEPRIRTLPDQPGDVRRTFADVRKAQRLFGYAPSVPFEEGLYRFAAWYRQEQEQRAALRIA